MEKEAEIIQKRTVTCVRGSRIVTLRWLSIGPVITRRASVVLQGHRMMEGLRWERASGDSIA